MKEISKKPFRQKTFSRNGIGRWQLRRKKVQLCAVAFCTRTRRSMRSVLCHTCEAREYRANHPITYAFNNLKLHAKQRGISFLLTRSEFKTLIESGNYINGRGRKYPTDLQVDRIDRKKGYEITNLRIITFEENLAKWHYVERQYHNQPF